MLHCYSREKTYADYVVYRGSSESTMYMHDVKCHSNETAITDCHYVFNIEPCKEDRHASVFCNGKVRDPTATPTIATTTTTPAPGMCANMVIHYHAHTLV